jgi:uncharacterized membrane protein
MTRPHDTEVVLGRVLTIGTRLSTALLVLGVVGTLTSAAGARALLSAGLVVLIATPIARVAVSVIEFARSREWWFVLCTAFVLALLLGSLIVALRG